MILFMLGAAQSLSAGVEAAEAEHIVSQLRDTQIAPMAGIRRIIDDFGLDARRPSSSRSRAGP